MIYILVGNDVKKKNAYLSSLVKKSDPILFSAQALTPEILRDYASTSSLFGDSPIIIIDLLLAEGNFALSPDDLSLLSDSSTVFIFREDKLLAAEEKKYKKYATIERFEEKKAIAKPKANPFALADAFARRDKISAWILYCQAIEEGSDPEPISGILFWKIKSMILSGTKSFKQHELQKQSSDLVSLYHRAHRGECDFVIGLEQFILSSLSS